ncbi:chemotaxis protein CheB [Luedemannella flava]|uniref:protein-glutamate methylesterase n=1 Tax=Luedemannella flava TaxID=349316 RepID=A0ABP4XJV4_9ACTN
MEQTDEVGTGAVAHRDVIVVGASAGGVEALRVLVARLPDDLPAAVLIVLHVPRSGPSALPLILSRVTNLPVRPAVDGEPLRHGRVYVAPVDRHLLLLGNRIRLSRGPAENGHRPAIDPLFRSAARAFGPRVIGVVLSGSRDDGAAGLAAIADRGGTTVVQDPADAIFPSMPLAALEHVNADKVLPLAEIGEALGDLCRLPAPEGQVLHDDPTLDAEVAMSDLGPITADELPGHPAGYGCPACGGSLYELIGKPVPRYRCRVGHAWSPESLLEEQAAALESALWMALRALEEKVVLSRRLAETNRLHGHTAARDRYRAQAEEAESASALIRNLIDQVGAAADGEAVYSTE